MKRVTIKPRDNWQKRLEDAGCEYHTIDGKPYWNEGAAYEFSSEEIDCIEAAGDQLHEMCRDLVGEVVGRGDYEGYGFPDEVKQIIQDSWLRDIDGDPHLIGRLDLGYDGKDIKLFEYNADTPTALPEASVWQYHALQDHGWPDQFNSIHEALVERWKQIAFPSIEAATLHFAAHSEGRHEDFGNLHYLLETAAEAGCQFTASINIEEIGWDEESKYFVDGYPRTIQTLFKLYPWEWMMADEYGWRIAETKTKFIEPPWKMLLSTKAILPLLWKRHPGHPLLLEAYFEEDFGNLYKRGGTWVKKPMLGREGANVNLIYSDGKTRLTGERDAKYDKHGYIYQQFFSGQRFTIEDQPHKAYPVLGVWIIGDKACGMGIREDEDLITTNASQFVPHYFVE